MFKDALLRTRRALFLHKVFDDCVKSYFFTLVKNQNKHNYVVHYTQSIVSKPFQL